MIKRYSIGERRYLKRNIGNHARNNLESLIRCYYLCEPDWESWLYDIWKCQTLSGIFIFTALTIPVVYPDIDVQPCAISGGKNLAGLKITLYLCHRKKSEASREQWPLMHYFWLWMTFFAESWTFLNKALLGKLRWRILRPERSVRLLCRDGRALIHRRHNPQSKSGLTLYEPTPMGRTPHAQHPEVCAWISQPDAQNLANKSVCEYRPKPYTDIGAHVQTWHLWTLSTYLHHTHPIADNVSRRREIVQIWKSRIILLSLCNDWRQRTPEATRSAL